MKASLKTTMIVAASITFGAAAVQLLHAASGPPVLSLGKLTSRISLATKRSSYQKRASRLPRTAERTLRVASTRPKLLREQSLRIAL
jgi:hypothetical protein